MMFEELTDPSSGSQDSSRLARLSIGANVSFDCLAEAVKVYVDSSAGGGAYRATDAIGR